MSLPKSRILDSKDCAICKIVLGFLTTPLVLLLGAAGLIAV